MRRAIIGLIIAGLVIISMSNTCSTNQPMRTVDYVELETFMGTWFIIGYTPILVDKKAHNGVEHYYLDGSGKILTTYQFREGSASGKIKTYQPTGFVHGENNAEWRMRFIWPFKAKYLIYYLSKNKKDTIITHPNRKYAWIMSRKSYMTEERYKSFIKMLEADNFNTEAIRKMPQDWENDQKRLSNIDKIGATQPLEPR